MLKCYITNGMLGQDHYIYRLRAACMRQPHWNRYQLAALDRELQLVLAASTPEEHLRASGDMIGLARGEALDRAANALDIARRYGDPWGAAAAAIEFAHAQSGANHLELLCAIQTGHQIAGELRTVSAAVQSAIARLFSGLLIVHTSNFDTGAAYMDIDAAFALLRRSDPCFQPHTWLDHPRYRLRLPWNVPLLHQWLEPYWDHYPLTAPDLPVDPGPLPPPAPDQGLVWPPADLPGTPADTTVAGVYLRRQAEWPDEFLAAFWTETRDLALECASSIAQYAVANDREARFAIEGCRNMLHLSALLAPLRAAVNHGWEQSQESREGLEKAVATTCALTGYSPAELLLLPRVRHFLENNLQPRLERGTDGFGAMAGEAGFDLVRHALSMQLVKGHVEFVF